MYKNTQLSSVIKRNRVKQVCLLFLMFMAIFHITYSMECDNESQTPKNSSEAWRLVGEAEKVLEGMQKDLRHKVFTKEGQTTFITQKHAEALDFSNQARALAEGIQENEKITAEIIKETNRTLNRVTVIELKVNRK